MKVSSLQVDVSRYRWVHLDDGDLWKTEAFQFDGSSKAAKWVPPTAYIAEPTTHKASNFMRFHPGAFVIDERCATELASLLERSGELLPILIEETTGPHYIYNVTSVVNLLDVAASRWATHQGVQLYLETFAFKERRFNELCFFKIHQQPTVPIFALEQQGVIATEDEFSAICAAKSLTGLIVKEEWTNGRHGYTTDR
jgi:hypothetical protein